MAFWTDGRGVDHLVSASDRTLNIIFVVLLAAFALATSAYYYGQMHPRVSAPVTNPAAALEPGGRPAADVR